MHRKWSLEDEKVSVNNIQIFDLNCKNIHLFCLQWYFECAEIDEKYFWYLYWRLFHLIMKTLSFIFRKFNPNLVVTIWRNSYPGHFNLSAKISIQNLREKVNDANRNFRLSRFDLSECQSWEQIQFKIIMSMFIKFISFLVLEYLYKMWNYDFSLWASKKWNMKSQIYCYLWNKDMMRVSLDLWVWKVVFFWMHICTKIASSMSTNLHPGWNVTSQFGMIKDECR